MGRRYLEDIPIREGEMVVDINCTLCKHLEYSAETVQNIRGDEIPIPVFRCTLHEDHKGIVDGTGKEVDRNRPDLHVCKDFRCRNTVNGYWMDIKVRNVTWTENTQLCKGGCGSTFVAPIEDQGVTGSLCPACRIRFHKNLNKLYRECSRELEEKAFSMLVEGSSEE